MNRRGLSVAAACGALVLLLASAQVSSAQVFIGRGGAFFYPVGPSYPMYGPGYGPRYSYSYPGYNTGYTYTGGLTADSTFYPPAPLYYGAAAYGRGGYSSAAYSPYAYGPYATSVSPLYTPVAFAGASTNTATASSPFVSMVRDAGYTTFPVTPVTTRASGEAARLEVHLPAQAELWVDDQQTRQTGSERTFHSPALEAGSRYVYEVRARWTEKGETIDQVRKVRVRAGDHVVVDFLKPEPTP